MLNERKEKKYSAMFKMHTKQVKQCMKQTSKNRHIMRLIFNMSGYNLENMTLTV